MQHQFQPWASLEYSPSPRSYFTANYGQYIYIKRQSISVDMVHRSSAIVRHISKTGGEKGGLWSG